MSEQKYCMTMVDSAKGRLPKIQPSYKNQSVNCKQQSQSSNQNIDVHIGFLKRFQAFLLNQKLIKLSTALKRHCGRHFPIGYRPQFGFTQYWQDQKSKFQESNILQFFQYPKWYYYIFALVILISKLVMIWCLSIHRLFQVDASDSIHVLFWGLITLVCDIVLQFSLFSHYDYFNEKDGNLVKYFKSFWKDALLIIYFITMPIHYNNFSHSLLLIDVVATVLLSKRCEEIKRIFRIQITSTSYKDAFNVLELFCTLLPIAHIFALTLYYAALCNSQKNWLNTNDLVNLQPYEQYVYSLYFAFTTMLTVGYGDITPVNIPEILIVIGIQIIGIITYGYIVNEIGHIIGNMRREDELLSRDISTISKMAKYYDLDKNLVQKARNFLVCQKRQKSDLTPQEEEITLSKLHDDLRQQISRQNSLRILKSSLFYVCNWTKKFQIQIAKKVHKKVFSPSEQIIQVAGKERIYIFKKGKVQIHANRIQGYKKHFKKILRVIEPKQTLQVSDNIYGYSFIMSNTPIKLSAVNKEFVVAYYVERKDFLQTVMNSHLDIEYYFEMKTKIDSVSYPESWEAPLIINTKEHYIPNIQYLIRKNKSVCQKQKNVRTSKFDFRRLRNRTKRLFYRCIQEMEGECMSNVADIMKSMITGEIKTDKVIGTSMAIGTYKSIDNYQLNSLSHFSTSTTEKVSFAKQNLHYLLEQGKEYSIYFRCFNRTEVLMKLQNSNYMAYQKKVIIQTRKPSTLKTQELFPSIFKESMFSLEL